MLVEVLQETQKYRVHRHAVHREEGGGDGVGSENDDGHRNNLVIYIQVQSCGHVCAEEREGDGRDNGHHDDLAEEEDEVSHFVQHKSPGSVAGEESEALPCSSTEIVSIHCGHDVGVPVDKPDELLQTPEAAFTEAENAFNGWIVRSLLLDLVLDVLQQDPDHPGAGEDQ